MIRIWGSTGYMGLAVVAECNKRGLDWSPGSRDLRTLPREAVCDLAINCAAYIPLPTVDACKDHQQQTIIGNVVWPSLLAQACDQAKTPIIHLSSGCLYNESRMWTEEEMPTRGWDGYCGWYVGAKLSMEKMASQFKRHYILRLRLPFDEVDHPRNYLSKLKSFGTVYEHENSLTHRGDFAKWALDLAALKAPFGTYHCVNPGTIHADELVTRLHAAGIRKSMPMFAVDSGTTGATLSTDKLENAGVRMRTVEDALNHAITNWKSNV